MDDKLILKSDPNDFITIGGLQQLKCLLLYMNHVTMKKESPDNNEDLEKGKQLIEKYIRCRDRINDYYGMSSDVQKVTLLPSMVNLVRKSVLTHQWFNVMRLVHALVNESDKAGAVIWKAGLTSLIVEKKHKHIDQLIRSLYKMQGLTCTEVMLDYTLYLLMEGNLERIDLIPQEIQNYYMYTTKEKPNEYRTHVSLLVQAYVGLSLYLKWKAAMRVADIFSACDATKSRNRELAKMAVEKLSVIRDHPGVWDLFIDKIVEMNNHYDEMDKSMDVLTHYVTLNPGNPVAHLYLYFFRLEYEQENKQKVENLKNIIKLDPSNPLVLDLCSLLESEKPGEAIVLLFDFLDFDHCHDHLEAWKKFDSLLASVKGMRYAKKRLWAISSINIKKCWAVRKDWWPRSVFKAKGIHKPDCQLQAVKTQVYKRIQTIAERQISAPVV